MPRDSPYRKAPDPRAGSVHGNDGSGEQVVLDLRQQQAKQSDSGRAIEAFDSDEDHGGLGRAIEKQKVSKVMVERHDSPPSRAAATRISASDAEANPTSAT